MRQLRSPFLALPIFVCATLLTLGAAWAASGEPETARLLDEAQVLLDAERPEEALALVARAFGRGKPNGRGLLLRSTARFMLGEPEEATADLRRALEMDPSLRQGWLNLAAVEMSVERYDEAHRALLEAQTLAPEAADNDLNLGAVLLLKGEQAEADTHFARYLATHPNDPEAFLQVAGNYALAGLADAAIDRLTQAVALDERVRLRVRSDRRFDYFHLPRFRRLMNTDSYAPPPDAHRLAAAFPVRYDRQDPKLIDAVTDALVDTGLRYLPTIEATDGWALIWGDLRLKVSNQPDGNGVVELSAPAERFTEADWHRTTQDLLRAIHRQLAQQRASADP